MTPETPSDDEAPEGEGRVAAGDDPEGVPERAPQHDEASSPPSQSAAPSRCAPRALTAVSWSDEPPGVPAGARHEHAEERE